ncbi:hypothetical protein MTsPCn5_16560 [Croceitalea sp. MTPC5]|nr:hypothetical protein MTsPCn5_16560 [Croceitalea sp. MTPC5]
METMVATVLIVIIFMVASLVMNSLLAARAKNDVQAITQHLKKLEYQYVNKMLTLPYFEDWNNWQIEGLILEREGLDSFELKATNTITQKKVATNLIAEE